MPVGKLSHTNTVDPTCVFVDGGWPRFVDRAGAFVRPGQGLNVGRECPA
jgi:hypothetical protein